MEVAAERSPLARTARDRPLAPTRAQRAVATGLREPRLVIFGAIILVMVFIGIFAPLLAPYDPIKPQAAIVLQAPSPSHILGTDNLGRDQFSRVIFGTRISLAVAQRTGSEHGVVVTGREVVGLVAITIPGRAKMILMW